MGVKKTYTFGVTCDCGNVLNINLGEWMANILVGQFLCPCGAIVNIPDVELDNIFSGCWKNYQGGAE